MIARFLTWLTWFVSYRKHEHEWEPVFYGRVYHDEDLFVVIDVCRGCGASIARTP